MEISAIIVARGGSVRLPRKNLLPINGETLVSRKIRQLKESRLVNRVIVGSDDDEILREAENHGAEAVLRPAIFCDERVTPANGMIGNMMDLVNSDVIVWAHCTNPLLSSGTYDRAIKAFFEVRSQGFDSLVSVFELREHLWDSGRKPFNYDPYGPTHVLASQIPPLFAQDGGIFIQMYEDMKANSYFFGRSPFLFEVPKEELMDVNTPHEFAVAKSFIEAVEKDSL